MRSFSVRGACLLIALLLVACSGNPVKPGQARYYVVHIPAADGTLLTATVYQPALAPGASAPLIIHTHAFAGWRMTSPSGFYSRVMISGRAALAAWKAGYWVVSYDQRGWGESHGKVMLMDPRYEVSDVSSVIDWSLAHLPAVQGGKAHPRIGMIGESYGGAVQLLAAAQDPRITAIVPIATWYDLSQDLAPAGVVKTTWLSVLGVSGELMSHGDAGILLHPPYVDLLSGHLNAHARDLLYEHSPAYACQHGHPPQADALLIQGLRDSLFPLDDAIANRDCILAAHHDARLLAIQGGHMLFWPIQVHAGLPLFHTDRHVDCGQPAATMTQTILAWWDLKLRGRTNAPAVPAFCVNISHDHGLTLTGLPNNAAPTPLPAGSLRPLFSGTFDGWSEPLLRFGDHLLPSAAPLSAASGGFGRALFLPLPAETGNGDFFAAPRLDIDVTAQHAVFNTRLFVAVGLRRAGQRSYRALSDQWTPLPGIGHWQIQLPMVAAALRRGDQLGLVVRGFSGQYLGNGSWSPTTIDVRATLALPKPFPRS